MNETQLFPPILPGDWYVKSLDVIMGFGDGGSVISSIWLWINSAAAMMAGIYSLYLIVVGTFNTGHQGSVMGKWNEYWFVARMAFAVSLFVPTVNNVSVVQYVFYGAARLGSSGANAIWALSLEKMGKDAAPISTVSAPSIENFAKGYFGNHVCSIAANLLAQKLGKGQFIEVVQGRRSDEMAIYYNGKGANGIGVAACGGYVFPIGDDALREAEDRLIGVKKRQVGVVKSIVMGRIALMNDFTAAVQPVAIKMARAGVEGAEMPSTADAQALSAAMQRFQSGMNNEVKQLLAAYRSQASANARIVLDEFSDVAQQWSTAGLWAMRIADMNATILRASQTVPDIKYPNYLGFGKDNRIVLQRTGDQASLWWDRELSMLGNKQAIQRAYNSGASESIWGKIGLSDHLVQWFVIDSGENPVGDLVALGHKLIWAFEAAAVSVATISGVAEGAKSTDGPLGWGLSLIGAKAGAGFITGALSFLGPLLTGVLLSLLIPGIQLAYLLPMSPFIFWIYGMAMLLIRFTQALMGAPLWAVAHIAPSGEDLVSERAQAGYGLALEVVFRPVVMVISLIVGLMIMTIMGGFFVETFYSAMRSSMGNNSIDIVLGAIVSVFIATTILMGLSNMCFSIIATAPDDLLTILGMRSTGDGDKIQRMVDTNAIKAAIGTNQIESAVRSGLTPRPKNKGNLSRKDRLEEEAAAKKDADRKKSIE